MKPWVVAFWVSCLSLLFMSGTALAETMADRYVMGFDGEDVEGFRESGNNRERVILSISDVGQPPIRILEQNDQGFVRVKGSNGDMLWLRKGDLITDDKANVPTCNQAAGLTHASDRTIAGMRGVGEKCK